ncbi:MAG: hypothetical protein ACK5OX_11560 [Desertimonas sp.]
MSTTTIDQQITELNAGWYNHVSSVMNLDPATFQLAQGTLGLQTSDSSGLFRMADAVPPSASVAYFDPGSMQLRSQSYGMLLQALLPETGVSLQQALGDQYANWITFRNAYWTTNPTSTETQEQVFTTWANQRLDPNQASSAITAYKDQANCPLNNALDAYHSQAGLTGFIDPSGKSYSLYTYTGTVSGANNAFATAGQVATIDFDTSSMNTTLSHTTVNGSATGWYEIFAASASASFDQLNATAAAQRFTIKGSLTYTTLVTQAVPQWYDSAEVTRAYSAQNDNTVWNAASNVGSWSSFFGDDGGLARHVSQLVLVTDCHLTVTSYADYSSEDCTEINAKADIGIWPFFDAKSEASYQAEATVNDDGSLTFTHDLDKGQIEIWGATVEAAPS